MKKRGEKIKERMITIPSSSINCQACHTEPAASIPAPGIRRGRSLEHKRCCGRRSPLPPTPGVPRGNVPRQAWGTEAQDAGAACPQSSANTSGQDPHLHRTGTQRHHPSQLLPWAPRGQRAQPVAQRSQPAPPGASGMAVGKSSQGLSGGRAPRTPAAQHDCPLPRY